MYWLIGASILMVMLASLSVAANTVLLDELLHLNLDSTLIIPFILIVIATTLIVVNEHRASKVLNASDLLFQDHYSFFHYFVTTTRYLLIAVLAVVLILTSAVHALQRHQQAELNTISKSMRVQALVTIEGVSDSLYNVDTDSSYRQLATIKYISPLVTETSSEDLTLSAATYLENSLNDSQDSPRNHPEKNALEPSKYQVLLNAYPKKSKKNLPLTALNELRPGDQLLMTLALTPLSESQKEANNSTGFDSYRWLRSRHIDGLATIIASGTPIGNATDISINPSMALTTDQTDSISSFKRLRIHIDQWRWQLRQHFYQHWSTQTTWQQQANAVTLSLLTGDRSLINSETKALYQLAGISHLLAISGTHVLFLAVILSGAVVLLFNRFCPVLYRYIPRWQVRWLVMINAAFIYALFTGFDVPAARTAWMLLIIGLVRLTLLPISTLRVLLILAVLMAWSDPYVLWQAGYWLSFIAVALLLKYQESIPSPSRTSLVHTSKALRSNQSPSSPLKSISIKFWEVIKRVVKLQCWLFIALLPVTLLLFGKVSLWGLVINLFAIGLFGWVIVPLNLLAGLSYLLVPSVADSIWTLVSAIIARLHELIVWLTSLPTSSSAWLYTSVNAAILLMVVLIMLPWLLPKGLLNRALALPTLILLTMSMYASQNNLLIPTLYILPTDDRYLSASVLQYPNNSNANATKKSINWLFLADHRPRSGTTPGTTRSMPSSLNSDKLSALLEQQLRTLSIKQLEGIVIQTSVVTLDDKLPHKTDKSNNTIELLSMTVAELTQRLPTNQYWQAGRHESWSTHQQLAVDTRSSKADSKSLISVQSCEEGKIWQSTNNELSLKVLTGWSKIEDSGVWDCTVAVESRGLIQVLKYNGSQPSKSLPLTEQLSPNTISSSQQDKPLELKQSRLVLDTATHHRVWQLWSLLCNAQPFAISSDSGKLTQSQSNSATPTTWLSHSASSVSEEILTLQNVNTVLTYDNQPLEVAFNIGDKP